MNSFKNFIKEVEEYKAREGESEVVHHLTHHRFGSHEFLPLSHFGTKAAARTIIRAHSWDRFDPTKTAISHHAVRIKLGNVARIPDGEDHFPHGVNDLLYDHGHITQEQYENHRKNENLTHSDLARTLRKNGIHTLAYTNEVEDPGSTSYMITHPSQIRRLRHSHNAKVNVDRAKW